jgi:hypothetical protein
LDLLFRHVRHRGEVVLAGQLGRSEEWHHRHEPHLLAFLCDLHGSDKGSLSRISRFHSWEPHSYVDVYAQLFDHCRFSVSRVFECGIGSTDASMRFNMGRSGVSGASLRVWRDYFPNAEVIGADLDGAILFEEERIRTFQVDQTSATSIATMWQEIDCREFDLMIDDGLHEPRGGITLFDNSIDRLSPTGVYVIEDVYPDHLSAYVDHFERLDYRVSVVLLRREPGELAANNLVIIRKPWESISDVPSPR